MKQFMKIINYLLISITKVLYYLLLNILKQKRKKLLHLGILVIYVLKILILKKLFLWVEKDGK